MATQNNLCCNAMTAACSSMKTLVLGISWDRMLTAGEATNWGLLRVIVMPFLSPSTVKRSGRKSKPKEYSTEYLTITVASDLIPRVDLWMCSTWT